MSRFTFTYHRNRWGHRQTVNLTKTAKGWDLDAQAYTGPVGRDGSPLLYGNFVQDSVAYPEKMKYALEHVWEQIDTGAWSAAVAQERLQELADWVSACELAEPKWPGWN